LIVLALLIVGAAAYAFSTRKALSPAEPVNEAPGAVAAMRYTNFEHDFRFTYPEGYVLTEAERGDAHRGHYQVMLVAEENAVPPENGEGPTAITVDVYQNDIDQQPVMNWITTTNIANFKLGDGKLAERRVGGEAAYTNTWSGLYEGKTTTFAHGDDIIAVSVTWLTPEDEILEAYEHVLDSFEFGQFDPPVLNEDATPQ
ncbi:MAG TPA: hypothetical protein VEA36_01330, partial [Candidatus Paceibacterota bacterium]|nr:hypothetical protein [Candidatus Paceibacterota bacterium]